MWRDLIHSLRVIRRYPFSSVSIVLVLALGIGANTAMFASFHAWITRPLDFADPERLVAPYATRPARASVGARSRLATRPTGGARAETLEGLALFDRTASGSTTRATRNASLAPASRPLSSHCWASSRSGPDFGRRRPPWAARRRGADLGRAVARRFGGDPAAIGKDLRLDGRPHRIIGIMKPGFAFPEWARGMDPARPRPRCGAARPAHPRAPSPVSPPG